MGQEVPPSVDIDDALHKIDLNGKTKVNWGDKHRSHIQVWNSRARLLCHEARLEDDMSPAYPYFRWYNRVTWRFVDHTVAAVLIMVIASTFLFKFCCCFSILLRITIFVLDVLIVFIYLQIASHKQLLTCYIVGSPEYNKITAVLKAVDCLHRITT